MNSNHMVCIAGGKKACLTAKAQSHVHYYCYILLVPRSCMALYREVKTMLSDA